MTRAALSGILTHVGSLSDAEVSELEKLAENFPYCQTAHVLLAKALHDRGSMLAGQKLRRAATCAADRRVLRRLLLAPALPEAEQPAGTLATEAAPSSTAEVSPAEDIVQTLAVSETGELVTAPPAAAAPTVTAAAAEAAELPAEEEPVAEAPVLVAPLPGAQPEEDSPADESEAEAPAPVIADFDLVPDTGPAIEDLLLFESEAAAEAVPAGLALLTDALPVALLADAPAPVPPLEADPAVDYAIASSRLGAELLAADLWPTTEKDLLAPWLPDAPPDARWTEHAAAHQPPQPVGVRRPFDHQFALIDRFLRERPRLRTVDPTRPLPEKLPDLAQRSARPDDGTLVSESMARILARQGKTTRAIAMYEQLQAKFPEKAGIFAAQIAALRSPEA